MHKEAGKIFFSPTDLTNFMVSPFASWMQRWQIEDVLSCPEKDPETDLTDTLSRKGYEHEQNILNELKRKGLQIVDIKNEYDSDERNIPFHLKQNATTDAIKGKADVIFQAALQFGFFRGYADFLIKTTNSGLEYYEIWDTKLSSTVKPAHVIQLCCYSEMLTVYQKELPQSFVVALGNGDRIRIILDDYFSYYLALKKKFLNFQNNFNVNNMPDPADSRSFGRWETYATQLLKSRNHISLIANITRSQVKKLSEAGLDTIDKLLNTECDGINGIQKELLEKIKTQASLQKSTNGSIPPLFEIKKINDQIGVGLSMLPPHSPFDIFFDLEGYPLEQGGLEYLWGYTYYDKTGSRVFSEFWAHNPDQEKKAFESFICWAYQRWQLDPTMHIFHYGHYEITACRKLMARYGVCEYELDQLLRNDVFVDLYKIVTQGMFVGEPRYSIKNIEHLYRGQRDTQVGSGSDSVVVYEKWQTLFRAGLESDDCRESEILNQIRTYNIDDCNSTQELVTWLRQQQSKNGITYIGNTDVIEPEITEETTQRIKLRDLLLKKSLAQAAEKKRVTENLAWTLEFHRREMKPVFWRLFDRLGMEHSALIDDIDCLAMCRRTARAPFRLPNAHQLAFEYQMEVEQEFKIPRLENLYLLEPQRRKVKLLQEYSNFDDGIIVIQSSFDPGALITLIPDEFINPGLIQKAIDLVISDYANLRDTEFDQKHSAISDYLNRRNPNISGCFGNIVESKDPTKRLEETISAVNRLHKSYLIIQGPPGSGKTFTGSHLIANLIAQGKCIGVSSNSHKAINNLLLGVARCCQEEQIPVSIYTTKDTGAEIVDADIKIVNSNQIRRISSSGVVVGATAWGFCRPELEKVFDYLFVDEAGQVPMARLIGMSRTAENLILMGDQMQLSQPSQGVHPAESGLSVLDYAFGDTPIVESNKGIFLATSFRMHSKITQFISQAFYKGMLYSDPKNNTQEILGESQLNKLYLKSSGIHFVAVDHLGNQQASEEEAKKICEMVGILSSCHYRDKEGKVRPMSVDDMLFLAPYNHQVNILQRYLGESAKVGTVDKFQGQEAPVVFYSMCSSEPSESSRGLEFLYDHNRMNVAVSRGKCLVIIVGNPNLACPFVSTIEQIKTANIMSRLILNY